MLSEQLEPCQLTWRKAKRSMNNGDCVEVAPANRQVLIRDSMDQDGPVVQYSEISWRSFLADAKRGRFDLDSL
jgi:hypothetical protein